MLVGERVEGMLGLAPPLDQAHRAQGFQARRHRRDLLVLLLGQIRYASLPAGKPHQIFLLEAPLVDEGGGSRMTLSKFDLCTQKTDKLLDDVGAFQLTSDGEKALYEQLPPRDPNGSSSSIRSSCTRYFGAL